MWKEVEAAPADAILGLTEAFKKDTNPNKVNLGVGVYKDDQGNTPILACIKEASGSWLRRNRRRAIYLFPEMQPMEPVYRNYYLASRARLLLRSVRRHSFTGRHGRLRVGDDLIKRFSDQAKIWVSQPTWANHKGIFSAAGFEIAEYPYYDATTKRVDFEAMIAALERCPRARSCCCMSAVTTRRE